MKRRDFVRRAVGTVVGAGMIPGVAGCGEEPRGPAFSAWTWVHGDREHSGAEWRARFGRIRAAGIDGVLCGGGDTRLLAEAARAEGLAIHRWMWTLNRNGDARVQQEHPEWFTVSRDGASSLVRPPYVDYYRWLCPTREPVRDYLVAEMARVAEEPVGGVHLDYVRHCDVILPRGLWATYDLVQDTELAEFDFCYCEVCREEFARADGRDPLEIADPATDEAWRRFRWDAVTGVVESIAGAVKARSQALSAAVFPTPTIARRLVRQAWDEWPVDMVFPMLYHSFYEEDLAWIGNGIREGVAALGGRPLYAGLYLPSLPPVELGRAVALARDVGASGVSFFEMEGLTDEHLTQLRQVLSVGSG